MACMLAMLVGNANTAIVVSVHLMQSYQVWTIHYGDGGDRYDSWQICWLDCQKKERKGKHRKNAIDVSTWMPITV